MILGIVAGQKRNAPPPAPAGLAFDPANIAAGFSLTESNTRLESVSVASSTANLGKGNAYKNSGSWYAELVISTLVNTSSVYLGVVSATFPLTSSSLFVSGEKYSFYRPNGAIFHNGQFWTGGAPSYAQDDVFGIAYSAGDGKVKFYKNGSLLFEVPGIIGSNLTPVAVTTNVQGNVMRMRTTPLHLPAGYSYWA